MAPSAETANDQRSIVSRLVSEQDRFEARSRLRPPGLAIFCPGARSARILFEPPNGWSPLNPSVCLHLGELWCVVRTVNYALDGKRYVVRDPHGVICTENYLGRLDLRGRFLDPTLMRDLDPTSKPTPKKGYADVRLVSVCGKLAGSASVLEGENSRIARLSLDATGNVVRADVQPSNQLHEKNWMPLSVNNEFKWIYSLDPVAVVPGPLRKCPFALEYSRGGAATRFGDGYLCVTHEVTDGGDSLIYWHRLVCLDARFNVTRVSPAWIFSRHGIEFCAGIAVDGDDLVLSYGIDDREAWITRVSVHEICKIPWIDPVL